MGNTKGNSEANVGYSCEQRELVAGWRKVGVVLPWWPAVLPFEPIAPCTYEYPCSPYKQKGVSTTAWCVPLRSWRGAGRRGVCVDYSATRAVAMVACKVWSETAGTTDPNAPFGIVTLADSGGEK